MSPPSPPFFVFDGGCGFCVKWVRWLGRRAPDSVTFVPYQDIDDLARFGLTGDDVRRASYWIDDQGRRYRGNRSIAQVLKRSGGRWRVAGTIIDLPVIRMLAAAMYVGVSRNRHRLPAPP